MSEAKNENQFRTLGFVSGTEEEQEKQKSEIRKRCQKEGLVIPVNDEFISDWQTLEKELQAYEAVVVFNLRLLSTDVKEVAQMLYTLIYEYKKYVYSVNEEQDTKVLTKRRQKHVHIAKSNMLAGLEIDLHDVL